MPLREMFPNFKLETEAENLSDTSCPSLQEEIKILKHDLESCKTYVLTSTTPAPEKSDLPDLAELLSNIHSTLLENQESWTSYLSSVSWSNQTSMSSGHNAGTESFPISFPVLGLILGGLGLLVMIIGKHKIFFFKESY